MICKEQSLIFKKFGKNFRKFNMIQKNFKSNLDYIGGNYAEACNEWRTHISGLTPGLHSFRNVAVSRSNLTFTILKPEKKSK